MIKHSELVFHVAVGTVPPLTACSYVPLTEAVAPEDKVTVPEFFKVPVTVISVPTPSAIVNI